MGDAERYTEARALRDPDFAERLESGYAEFRLDVLRRARRGSRAAYEAALAQVPDVELDDHDRE